MSEKLNQCETKLRDQLFISAQLQEQLSQKDASISILNQKILEEQNCQQSLKEQIAWQRVKFDSEISKIKQDTLKSNLLIETKNETKLNEEKI